MYSKVGLRMSCGQLLPLAIVVYRASACTLVISASAAGVQPLLLLFICASTAVCGRWTMVEVVGTVVESVWGL